MREGEGICEKDENMKSILKYITCAGTAALLALISAVPAWAANTEAASQPIQLVVDSDYLTGKVNDPVSKKTKTGFIVCENAEFHLEAVGPEGKADSAQVVFYINEYVDGQDQGAKNRVLMREIKMDEATSMLPEEVFTDQIEDGAAYDFINRCYDVRVYMDAAQTKYQDYYFGLVDELTYQRMSAEAAAAQAVKTAAANR